MGLYLWIHRGWRCLKSLERFSSKAPVGIAGIFLHIHFNRLFQVYAPSLAGDHGIVNVRQNGVAFNLDSRRAARVTNSQIFMPSDPPCLGPESGL